MRLLNPLLGGICVLLLMVASVAHGNSYEAPLPAQLSTDPDLCAYVPCKDVIAGADSFSERKGKPAYVEAYRRKKDDHVEKNGHEEKSDDHEKNGDHQGENDDRELIGYVFLSTDIVDIPAYSGKPVVTLIGMDTKGLITGAKILRHSEPILLLGIPEAELTKFIKQYVGKFVGDKIEIGKPREGQGYIGLDAITGATVTVVAQNQVMMRCGVQVARQVGILKPTIRPQAKFTVLAAMPAWDDLIADGSVQRLLVKREDVGLEANGTPYIDLWFGYLNQPTLGRAILGKNNYESLMERLKPDEHAIFIIRTGGGESFKGSGFVRGGIYDRIQVAQDMDTFTFRDLDYLNLYGIEAAGAPAFTESAIFIIRSKSFSAAYPWKLVFLANRMDKNTGHRTFTSFDAESWLPDAYLQGGRPEIVVPDPTWLRIWKDKVLGIVAFTALLILIGAVYAKRDWLVRRCTRKNKHWVDGFKYFGWVVSIIFVGFTMMAQPSITQVLTWFHALLFQWKWELFLTDPYIFIFWWFIIITVFIWGRGLFCGWLCPFGSLSELLYKVAGWVGLKRFQFLLPARIHHQLKWLKYAIFYGLLAVSFFSMGLAEKLAEVEPFKTTFLVGMFNRTWPYTLFVAVLLGLSIFTERPFCKYLCPLGAALAVPTTFRWFGLKRKQECTKCTACAVGCGSQAINPRGEIDQRECMLCLDCMVMYYEEHACPPLSQERKRRERAGLPLTPIGDDGYYIPIKPVPMDNNLPETAR
jgi:NosR/NirI family nitrous oxide reductase transcriptional regulator